MNKIILVDKDGRLNCENISISSDKRKMLKDLIKPEKTIEEIKLIPEMVQNFQDLILEIEEEKVISVYVIIYDNNSY
jgi:hypothetical protein